MIGSTRVVTNRLGSLGPASFRVPMIRLSVIVSSSILPPLRSDWNWLYGRYSVWRVSWMTACTTNIARTAIITYQALKWLFLSMPPIHAHTRLPQVCARAARVNPRRRAGSGVPGVDHPDATALEVGEVAGRERAPRERAMAAICVSAFAIGRRVWRQLAAIMANSRAAAPSNGRTRAARATSKMASATATSSLRRRPAGSSARP